MDFLRTASVISRSPAGAPLSTQRWDIQTGVVDPDTAGFPFTTPESPATLPAVLKSGEYSIEIAHWGEDRKTSGRDNVKFWAGSGGYPGAAFAKDALALVKVMPTGLESDPFNMAARQSSSFRFDWRRDYIPIDIGFSLNAHSGDAFTAVGYPAVEILAAIGLTHARPLRITKLQYQYGVITGTRIMEFLDPAFHRAALGGAALPFQRRLFDMHLGWPGQEGQARCITNVEELTTT